MATTVASRKSKGRSLQNKVADVLKMAFPQLEEDDVKPILMGGKGEDIVLSPAARRLIPYSIECKNQEKTSIFAWLKQAEANTKPNSEPVLIFKRNRSKTYVVVELDTWVKLIKK